MTSKPTGSVGWFQVFQRGQHYMKTWPSDKRLAPMFPENRISTATRFAVRIMPPVAVFTLTWQIALGGQLGLAVATAIFACSLPMQGLWWLGRRSLCGRTTEAPGPSVSERTARPSGDRTPARARRSPARPSARAHASPSPAASPSSRS